MSSSIVIAVCVLLLLAYLFDITTSKTKVPSVILLLGLGWLVQQLTRFIGVDIPDLNILLPVLGTVGLILIVLEGALELELRRNKLPIILRSSVMALLPMLLLSFLLAVFFAFWGEGSFKAGLVNAIPFAVISSAIAIPTVRGLSSDTREFVTYESSLSDIFGVLFFNFIALNQTISGGAVTWFVLDLVLMCVISLLAIAGLTFLLHRIKHHVKFVPIVVLIILIYFLSKIFHLPALLFILLFGLFLGNFAKFNRFNLIQRIHSDELTAEIHKFREITGEAAFFIRAVFFLMFGYLIETSQLLDLHSLLWAVCITMAIFTLRGLCLVLMRQPLIPMLFAAPRGLITILLFLSISIEQQLPVANKSLVIQVIILSALVMMGGMMWSKPKDTIE